MGDLQTHGAPNLPQNNLNGVNNLLPNDYEVPDHLNIRLFKWDAKISREILEDKHGSGSVNGIILLRASLVGVTATEVIVMPFSMPDVNELNFVCVLHEALKHVPMLSSLESLDYIAYGLMMRDFYLKYGLRNQFWVRYSDHVLVMIFDLKINTIPSCPEAVKDIVKEVFSKKTSPHISSFQVNAEVNLDKAEEIEECLKSCPGMIAEKASVMEEVMGAAEMAVSTGSEVDCPICMAGMGVGYRHVTTSCGHKFHISCIIRWQTKLKVSCPICRHSLWPHVVVPALKI